MMRMAIGGVVLGLALVQPAAAADWRLAGGSDRAVSFIDLSSIAKTGDNARFSRWMVLGASLPSRADNVRDSFEATCGSRAYRVLKAEFFERDRPAGALPTASAGTAAPDTVLASLIDIACGKRKADGPAAANPYAEGRARLAADKSRQ